MQKKIRYIANKNMVLTVLVLSLHYNFTEDKQNFWCSLGAKR